MKKAIVTGGCGFIGSHIVDHLISSGIETIVIDNNSAECNEEFYFNKKAKYYNIDICEYSAIFNIFKNVDIVFHLAAESRIQPAILNPIKATKVNVLGTCNVLQASRENGIDRVIYSSTSDVYGLENIPPLKESMKKNCINPYSITKSSGEDLCIMYNNLFGLKTISLRYFSVYGDREPIKGQYAPVVGLFLRQKKQDIPLTIVGDGLQSRDFVNVYDVVTANISAANTDNKNCFGKTYNVGTGISCSILDLAKKISNNYKFLPKRNGEAIHTLADISKIQDDLLWKPNINLFDYIKEKNDQ